MDLLVSGASGFIGKHLVPLLLKKLKPNDRLFVLSRTSHFKVQDPRCVLLHGNLENIQMFEKEILQCDYIFHLAGDAKYGNGKQYDAVNFTPTKKLVDIAKRGSRIKDFVYISTIGAVDRARSDWCNSPITTQHQASPRSDYGRSKLKAEQYIKKSGVPFTIIRPTWVWGPHMRMNSHLNVFTTLAAQDSPILKIGFPGKVSLVHVEDLCVAIANCIDNPKAVGKTYFARTEDKRIKDIFSIIYRKVQKRKLKQAPILPLLGPTRLLHSIMPASLSMFMVDYLVADDPAFSADLLQNHQPKLLAQHIDDVIQTNSTLHGYWIITGANSGIGLALAELLNKEKKKLVLIDKEVDALTKFKDARVFKVDLTSSAQIDELAYALEQIQIAGLINNAGVGYRRSFVTISQEEIDRTLAVNVLAPMRLTKALLESLVRQQAAIVNIASSVAYNPLPFMSLYAASKACILSWSESLSYELRETNLVVTFSPSGTNTKFQTSAGVAKGSGKGLLTPTYVASQILNAVRKRKKHVLLGVKSQVLVLGSSVLPRKFRTVFWGKLFEKYR